jgi:hypothetical protein
MIAGLSFLLRYFELRRKRGGAFTALLKLMARVVQFATNLLFVTGLTNESSGMRY